MPTTVVHRTTGLRYLLVGTGFAATETAMPSAFLGYSRPDIETKTCGMLALCDGAGEIHWRSSADYIIGEIDGVPPAQLIGTSTERG
jgi:hypothetical protein